MKKGERKDERAREWERVGEREWKRVRERERVGEGVEQKGEGGEK